MVLKAFGYWRSYFYPSLPDPSLLIDENWDISEKNKFIKVIKKGVPIPRATLGQSWCRFRCGKMDMGSQDLTNGKFVWPEGLIHYIEDHYVKPPIKILDDFFSYDQIITSEELENIEIIFDFEHYTNFEATNYSQKSYLASLDFGVLHVRNCNLIEETNKVILLDNLLASTYGVVNKKELKIKILKTTNWVEINGRFENLDAQMKRMSKNGFEVNFIEMSQNDFNEKYLI